MQHVHIWTYDQQREQWRCHGCGEVITNRDFEHRFGAQGELDVDPLEAVDKLAKERERVFKLV